MDARPFPCRWPHSHLIFCWIFFFAKRSPLIAAHYRHYRTIDRPQKQHAIPIRTTHIFRDRFFSLSHLDKTTFSPQWIHQNERRRGDHEVGERREKCDIYPISFKQRSSWATRFGWLVGTRYLSAKNRLCFGGTLSWRRNDVRNTVLNVPSPMRWWIWKCSAMSGIWDFRSSTSPRYAKESTEERAKKINWIQVKKWGPICEWNCCDHQMHGTEWTTTKKWIKS